MPLNEEFYAWVPTVKDDPESASKAISGSEQPSVSDWVCRLKDGDAEAAQRLWDRYFQKLVEQAEKRISSHNCPEGAVVPEDVAASVFESLWKGANRGRFQHVTARDELWWLLLAMTRRKVVSHIRHSMAQQRFPGKIAASLSSVSPGSLYQELVSDEPTAESVVMMRDQFSFLLSLLRDDKLRRIAVLKLEGHSNEEICRILDVSSATATRKLRLIRETWQQAIDEEGGDHVKI